MAKKIYKTDGVTITISSQWEMEVEGSGKLPDFTDAFAPWFKDREKITKVTIGPYIEYIGENSFEDFKNLETIVIMNHKTKVHEKAFTNCQEIRNVVAKKEIRDFFFTGNDYSYFLVTEYGYKKIKLATINETICIVDKFPLYTVPTETDVLTPFSQQYLVAENDCLLRKINSLTEVVFIGIKHINTSLKYSNIKRLFLPQEVESIEKEAFKACQKLKKIEFDKHSALSYLEKSVFQETAIKQITIPASVINIAEDCFYRANVEKVELLSDVSISHNAFAKCHNLKTVINSDFITKLESAAFEDCTSLETFDGGFAESISVIPPYCFANCKGTQIMNALAISNVKEIGSDAFKFTKIKECIAPKTLERIDAYAFTSSDIERLDAANSNLKQIDFAAFRNCHHLEEIILPNTVKSICDEVFNRCENIKLLQLGDSIEAIGSYCFTNLNFEFVIPKTILSLGTCPINNTRTKSKVDFSKNKNFEVKNGIIYDKEKNSIIGTTPKLGKKSKHIFIPNTMDGFNGFTTYEGTDPREFTIEFEKGSSLPDSINVGEAQLRIHDLPCTYDRFSFRCGKLLVDKEFKSCFDFCYNSEVEYI